MLLYERNEGIMIHDTIATLESKLAANETIKPESRAELLRLLRQLEQEIGGLAETDAERAQTVAGFTQVSTHEATRSSKNPELLELSLKGLARSTEDFEDSHPQLVAIVNRISTMLANMGI